jgi:hypothetical protein
MNVDVGRKQLLLLMGGGSRWLCAAGSKHPPIFNLQLTWPIMLIVYTY